MCLHEAGHHVTGGARYGLIVCWLTWPWQAIYRSVLETSARLLRLLSLLQTHRDWPGKDLSERLEVTPRTVRRDVERLRLLGYPVQARPGAGGGYRLGSGAVLPPLLLGDDEAVAIAVGLRSATLSGIAGIEETAVLALAKLEQVLPSPLRRRVRTLQAAIVPMTGLGPAPTSRCCSRSPPPYATPNACGWTTAATTVPRADGNSSRTGSCIPGAAGTSSPGTSSVQTGGRSGSTG